MCFSLLFPVNLTVKPGQNVTLSCRAPSNTDITLVEWTRPELKEEYVFVYRDGNPVPQNQHLSFGNRVVLKDIEMKDGDVSIILINVTSNDTGTYECRVNLGTTKRRKRATSLIEPISIIKLEVQSGESVQSDSSELQAESHTCKDKTKGL